MRAGLLAAPLVVMLVACTGTGTDGTVLPPPGATSAPAPSTPETVATSTPPAPTPDDASRTSEAPAADPEPALGAAGVSAGHPLAADAGMQILEQGGSAVDAVIAAAFADAVIQPVTSGIGGGGAALVLVDGEVTSYDYREVVNAEGDIPSTGVGIPGFVAGMARLHRTHGTLPWPALLAPAVELAEEGGPVSGFLAMTLSIPTGQQYTASLEHFRRADGAPLREGDRLVQQELARTMQVLADEGPEAFYEGSLAEALLEEPGIDAGSLAAYEVQVAEPASGPVDDHVLVSAAPALPGAALVQLVQLAEAGGIGEVAPYSPDFVRLQSQAWSVAERSVRELFGDPAFVDVPVDRLTDAGRNAAIAAEAVGAGLPLGASGSDPFRGGGNTTHISVVDEDGDAVSMTNTITHYWGSGRYVDGYFLNDHLTRFTDLSSPGNTPAPGRRSVSWSAPSMLLDGEGRPVLVIGTPGGQQIPNTIAAVVLRRLLHDEPLEDLVAAPRFIYTGGELVLETDDNAAELREMGYAVRVVDPALRSDFGSVNALEVDWDARTVSSVADPHRSAGFRVTGPAGS
ncbi:gamma-glutamyltranspeptidase [Ornithinimicrobium pekingense]|uniref:Gamma-glutamyltranspeptidase n=1 Tax=Ornithinimicrobium pekingense TaxID=384677 RepID=A0ABQ2F8S0_9MICO|nr:gamma-glutamyltranspeptidase [Ornithinimicrobium pekingense]